MAEAIEETPAAQESQGQQQPERQPDANDEASGVPATAILADRFIIDGARRLEMFDTPCAQAYAAIDQTHPDDALMALVCTPGIPVRTQLLDRIKDREIQGLLSVIAWGPVDWRPAERSVIAIIYPMPQGGRVIDSVANNKSRISEYDIVTKLIDPAVSAIMSLEERGEPHRAIRPDNLFYLDPERTQIVIGDCCSSPPGYSQPAIFETIERSMASPSGRGLGTTMDDIYALGFTVIVTLLGYNPLDEKKFEDVLARKIDRGSYAAICGNARIAINLVEPLRGMLNDDETSRWTSTELRSWLDGRKRTPQQRKGQLKADTPYIFKGRPHVSPISLAYAFARDPEEAFRTLKSDETFDVWVRRRLENAALADRISDTIEISRLNSGSVSGAPATIMARICSMLDPKGPLRYNRYALMPDSLGTALAVEALVNDNKKLIADIIGHGIYEFWFRAQERTSPEQTLWQRDFVLCKRMLGINDPGYGIERCLYEMNPTLACQSPILKHQYVSDIRELLPALDAAAVQVNANTEPLDRHVTAFIAARFDDDIQPHLRAVGSTEEAQRTVGMISLLAYLQWKLKHAPVHGLASWIGGRLQPAINSYHGRTTRSQMEKEIPPIVRQGSLPELFHLIDDPVRRSADETGFDKAVAEFADTELTIAEIQADDERRKQKLIQTGQRLTSSTAIILSLVFVTFIVLARLI